MNVLWIIAGVIVAIIIVVLIIGAALPQGHTATRTVEFRRSPREIWEALTAIPEFTSWRHRLKSVEMLPDHEGRKRWRETGRDGAMTMEAVEALSPSRLVTRIADTNLPFGGRWIYRIEPIPSGSRLTITEEGEVYNIFFRFMSRFIFGHTATIDEYLGDLGRKFGEPVEPTEGMPEK